MKTIREIAREYYVRYAFMGNDRAFAERHFEEGAAWMQVELTRWHDPKEELPDDDRDVLVKTTMCREYCIAFYKSREPRNYRWHENNGALDDDMVIGWREIHEL